MLTLILFLLMQTGQPQIERLVKINGSMAVTYTQLVGPRAGQFDRITDYDPDERYCAGDQVRHCKRVFTCIEDHGTYITGIDPSDETHWAKTEMHTHGFGISAQKRFKQALDNFADLFIATYRHNRNLLSYDNPRNGKAYRKPTFCTLTVPNQRDMSDKDVKAELFDRWLQNTRERHDVKLYVWRAEAQRRGAIHFHIVFDRYIDRKAVMKDWFMKLQQYRLHNPRLTFDEHNHICHIQELPDVRLIKHELAGYFAAKEDENGNLLYKHQPFDQDGNPVYVRKIDGRGWGYCDALKYKPLTIGSIGEQTVDLLPQLSEGAILEKEIKDANDARVVAYLYVYEQIMHSKKKPGEGVKPGKRRAWVATNREQSRNRMIQLYHDYYHLAFAHKIYGRFGLTDAMEKDKWDTVFNNRWVDVHHDWVDANTKLADYNAYKFATI